jgi:hypothetical protein
LSSSNVENKLKPIESDTVVQALKHNERRNMKKVKFDLNKNIVKWISNNEIVKPIQLKKNVDLISSNVENKLQPIESVNVELEVKEALADILNIICASDKRPTVQATQCYKCKEFGHKKNVCTFIAAPGVNKIST